RASTRLLQKRAARRRPGRPLRQQPPGHAQRETSTSFDLHRQNSVGTQAITLISAMRIRLAAVVAAVALLAGCAGGSKHPSRSYVDKVDAVANGLQSVTNDLYTPSDPSSAAAELTTVHAALAKAARQLAAITPPPAIRADHERLVKAIDEL